MYNVIHIPMSHIQFYTDIQPYAFVYMYTSRHFYIYAIQTIHLNITSIRTDERIDGWMYVLLCLHYITYAHIIGLSDAGVLSILVVENV